MARGGDLAPAILAGSYYLSLGIGGAAEWEMCCSVCERFGVGWAEPRAICCAAAPPRRRHLPAVGVLGVLTAGC